ncbi:MAG: hypothetical protein ACOC3J_05815 [Gemmatimonadota bacterium]
MAETIEGRIMVGPRVGEVERYPPSVYRVLLRHGHIEPATAPAPASEDGDE